MISKNILWNLSGNVLPLLVGAIVFPLLINSYGTERFGLLAIAWSLVGYFSLFDMGLSRALTQVVSEKLNLSDSTYDLSALVHTAFISMWGLGVIGGLCLWLTIPWLVIHALSVPEVLQTEAIKAFSIIAVSIPFVVHTSALKGVMDALHLFKQSSLIKMLLGAGTFLGPYLASRYEISLEYAAYSLVTLRIFIWAMHWIIVKNLTLFKSGYHQFQLQLLKPLFAFGGWMTISNIIGPLMVYLDRFVIAGMLGAAAVTYYVAPYEVITKLWVIPAAISGVLFPLFAQHWQSDPKHAANMLNKGIAYTLLLVFPAVMLVAVTAPAWLAIWLDQEFAVKSASIARWLAAGILINSVAQILYAKIQGTGKADWTAKLHLIESLPYWMLLWLLLKHFGIEGAAMAWFARVTLDFAGLSYLVNKIHVDNKPAVSKLIKLTLLACIIVIATIYMKNITTVIILSLFIALIYFKLAFSQLSQDGVGPFKNH